MIRLIETNEYNYLECYDLEYEDQRFVESPAHIMAEGYIFRKDTTVYNIYNGEALIGMSLIGNKPTLQGKNYAFSEFVIADAYKRQGLGTAAISAICEFIKKDKGFTQAKCCVYVDNDIARAFYKKIGFCELGPASWCEDFIEYEKQL